MIEIEFNEEYASELDGKIDKYTEKFGSLPETLELSEEEVKKLTNLSWEEIDELTPYGELLYFQGVPIFPKGFFNQED